MTCVHAHGVGCGCGDCAVARCSRRHEVPALREPLACALIACQIQAGPGMTWSDRTYEVIRASDGWLIDFGEGRLEPRRDWAAVVRWLELLRPRDVEMMEVAKNPETMRRPEIEAELGELARRWDDLRAAVEESGGSGGSPGEWMIERMDWLETALKRKERE